MQPMGEAIKRLYENGLISEETRDIYLQEVKHAK